MRPTATRQAIRAAVCAALVMTTATFAGHGARAGEFKPYEKPDPQKFAQGVAAYDARNFALAYEIWLPLAQHGDIAAVFNVALMLRDGRGIPQDAPRAVVFFRQCATWAHLGCQVDLAEMYYEGRGVPQSYNSAARWLLAAARSVHLPSMYKLGGMFERGEGVAPNLKAARTLYLAAYEGGYQPAGQRLSELAENAGRATGNTPAAAAPALAAPAPAIAGETRAPALHAPPAAAAGGNEGAVPPAGRQAALDPPPAAPAAVSASPLVAPNPDFEEDASAANPPAFDLRASLIPGGTANTAAVPIDAVRKSLAAMHGLDQRLYGFGTTPKTVFDDPLGGPDAEARPAACDGPAGAFDPHTPMCRMPPFRD